MELKASFVIIVLFLSGNAGASLPEFAHETWQVRKVNINYSSQRTMHYQHNDPRLVGRIIEFGSENIETNLPEKFNCLHPKYEKYTSDLNKLIYSSVGEANAEDYDFSSGNEKITAFNIVCQTGSFGEDSDKKSWIAQPDKRTLLTRWYDGTILTLSILDQSATPKASYSCERSLTRTEEAICSDYYLAAYDQSVSSAWEAAKEDANSGGDSALLKKINQSQKLWLVKRNQCGANVVCLTSSMVERLNELASEAAY